MVKHLDIIKKGLVYNFIGYKYYIITIISNLHIKSHQHQNLLLRHVHQVVHVFLVFQEAILIFEGICLKDLLLHPTTLHHRYLIL
jgi:hypothetical protein